MRIGGKADLIQVMTYGFATNHDVKGFTYYSGLTGSTSSTSYLCSSASGGKYATAPDE